LLFEKSRDLHPFNIDKATLELMTSDKIINYLEYREEKANEEIHNLRSHVNGMERHVGELERHSKVLENERQKYFNHAEDLAQHLINIKNTLSWRITAPLRKIYDCLLELRRFLIRPGPR